MSTSFWSLIFCIGLAAGLPVSRSAEPESVQLAQAIPLPGVTGRFDHFACDVAAQRLVVAALGNDTAEVIDIAAFKRLAPITGLHQPTGVLLLADLKRVYVAGGGDGTVRAFATASHEPVAQLDGIEDADNARFDPAAGLIYVGFGDGALGVIDPGANRLLHRIPLAAHPEAFQLETQGPRVFVNVPGARQIAVVDRIRRNVVAQWPMEQWRANFPMALDESGHRLFVGCRNPARLVVFDTEKGAAVADLEISGDTDDIFFDARRQRLYVSCGEGYLDVIQCHETGRYERIARLPTRGGARTCFFSVELDLLFLAVPARNGRDAEMRVYQPR